MLPKDICQKIIELRMSRHYGPNRMTWYLRKHYNWHISKNTIWRLYKEHGPNRLRYKKAATPSAAI